MTFRMDKSSRRRSPQEDKRLSYERDCVNRYGENDKAARKAVRRFKAASNRAGRRGVNQALHGLEESPDEVAHETALFQAEHLALRPRKVKVPDEPLKKVVPYRMRVEMKWARVLKPVLEELGQAGVTSARHLVVELNRRGVATPDGRPWSIWRVSRILKQLGVRYPWEWDGQLN